MAQAQGSSTSLRIGYETAFGVPSATTYEVPFTEGMDMKSTQAQNTSTVIRGSRNPDKAFLGFKDLQGTVSVPIDNDALGLWLKGFLGNPTTVDNLDGTYTHTFKVAETTLPSMFAEIAHKDLSLFYIQKGLVLNSFDISVGGDGELLMNMNILGKDATKDVTQLAVPDTSFNGGDKFQQFQASITGASSLKTFAINYSNNLDDSSYIIGDGATRGSLPLGLVTCGGTLEALYEDDTLLAESRANTTKAFVTTFTNGTNILSISMPETSLNAVSNVPITTSQGLVQSFTYQAFNKDDAGNSAITIALTNAIATYAAL